MESSAYTMTLWGLWGLWGLAGRYPLRSPPMAERKRLIRLAKAGGDGRPWRGGLGGEPRVARAGDTPFTKISPEILAEPPEILRLLPQATLSAFHATSVAPRSRALPRGSQGPS